MSLNLLFRKKKPLFEKCQVLIHFPISNTTHVFPGPFHDLNVNVERVSEISPYYHHTKPLAAVDQLLDFTYMSTPVFRSAPYTYRLNYLN